MQSFWTPVKSKPWKSKLPNMINLKAYPKRTLKEMRVINKNPYGDSDRDKVMNWYDCKPLDKKQDSKMLRREIARRVFGAEYYSGLPPEDYQSKKKPMGKTLIEENKKATYERIRRINNDNKIAQKAISNSAAKHLYPIYKKGTYKVVTQADIVKVLAKNPDLIKTAEEVKWSMAPTKSIWQGHIGSYGKNDEEYDLIKLKKRLIQIAPAMSKKSNLTHTIKHEIAHHKQWKDSYEHDPKEWKYNIKDEKGNPLIDEEGYLVMPMSWEQAEKKGEEELKKFNASEYAKHKYNLVKERIRNKAPPLSEEYIKSTFNPYLELPWRKRPIEIDAERRARAPHARDSAKLEGEKPEALQRLPKIKVYKKIIVSPEEIITKLKPIYGFSHADNIVTETKISPGEFLYQTYLESQKRKPSSQTYSDYRKEVLFRKHVKGIKRVLRGTKKSEYSIPIPFLELNERDEPIGHEGRHTMQALYELGIRSAPVTITKRKTFDEEKGSIPALKSLPTEIVQQEKEVHLEVPQKKLEQFKKDFNSSSLSLSNEQMRKKYGFKTDKEMIDYATKNNLAVNTYGLDLETWENLPEGDKESLIKEDQKRLESMKYNMGQALKDVGLALAKKEISKDTTKPKIKETPQSDIEAIQSGIKEEETMRAKQAREERVSETREPKEKEENEEAIAAWKSLSKTQKIKVGKAIATESEIPEYMHQRFSKEILESLNKQAK